MALTFLAVWGYGGLWDSWIPHGWGKAVFDIGKGFAYNPVLA